MVVKRLIDVRRVDLPLSHLFKKFENCGFLIFFLKKFLGSVDIGFLYSKVRGPCLHVNVPPVAPFRVCHHSSKVQERLVAFLEFYPFQTFTSLYPLPVALCKLS